MAKAEWGMKRICHNCGTRYYDMSRSPITCPNCGTGFDPEAFLKSRRTRSTQVEELPTRTAVAAVAAAPAAAADDEEEIIDTAEDTEAVDLAASDEGDADDDAPDINEIDDSGDFEGGEDDEDQEGLLEDASELGGDEDVEVDIDVPGSEGDEDR